MQELSIGLDTAREALLSPTAVIPEKRAEIESLGKELARHQALNRTLFAELRALQDAREGDASEAARRSELDRAPRLTRFQPARAEWWFVAVRIAHLACDTSAKRHLQVKIVHHRVYETHIRAPSTRLRNVYSISAAQALLGMAIKRA
jgi:hypothetical protein